MTCKAKDDHELQVTTPSQEINDLKNKTPPQPIIDLSGCEVGLKKSNGIDGNNSLILYKYYKDAELAKEKEVQFEVYEPINYTKLNLTGCKKIILYIPVNLNQSIKVYQNIIDQGYDPFDLGDKFYREICTQYDSENGTDVLLDAREEYYYSPIVDETTCQGNCHYSNYSLDTKYLMCECDVNNNGIVTLDVKHVDEENVAYSFYSSLKLSNYKVVICYNLVFNFKIFCHNYGSIISAIFLGLYIATMVYYCFRQIKPLKVEISKILFESGELHTIIPMDTKRISPQENSTKKSNLKIKSKKININNNKALPPKKTTITQPGRVLKKKHITITEAVHLRGSKPKKIYDQKSNDIMISAKKSSHNLLKKHEKTVQSEFDLISQKQLELKGQKEINKSDKKDDEEDIIDPTHLDNYELNNLKYELASEYDRRTCLKTYYSVIMREELVLFTFFSKNDYNLFYVKIARFLILITTSMAFNALFFFHKTMYKKQDIEENWSFWQKLPQLLFVLIANHIIEVYLCYLSMTDSAIYAIKAIAKKPKRNKKVVDIMDSMKRKLVAFFISTFILFLLFWYFISAFCAVYKNTQKIFIRDSAISFVTSLIDPFLIFGFTTILRKISLAPCCRKKAKFLYLLSDFIPIF